ncbi:MAG TPA: iron-siderophore ABC transporter substrate-binding protein [Pseudomonas sabulinigri]|nr:iron-siderophore ABC transporter substrate-binding protein [Halopseudomonas sabulinigri]HEC53008.1 iron-siderophore ABC transporter substrate-binding protein [Halopseudomonas sabulinigri]
MRLSLGLLILPLPVWGESLRVVTLFQGATDSAVALGVLPCGVVDSWSEKPMYRYLRQALAGVPHVGLETQPSLEDIVLLRPDVIIASRFRHERIAPLLAQMGRVVMLDEVFEFKQTLVVMGEALQRQQQASLLLAQWQQRVAQLRQQLQVAFAERWPMTISVLDIREDHIRSYLPASFAGSVLTELGFVWSPAAQDAAGVSLKLTSKESLPVVDADLFFIFQRSNSEASQRNYQQVLDHPLWQQLRAPQQGLVWDVDSVAWSLSGGILGANLMLDDIARMANAKALR